MTYVSTQHQSNTRRNLAIAALLLVPAAAVGAYAFTANSDSGHTANADTSQQTFIPTREGMILPDIHAQRLAHQARIAHATGSSAPATTPAPTTDADSAGIRTAARPNASGGREARSGAFTESNDGQGRHTPTLDGGGSRGDSGGAAQYGN